MKYIVTLNGKNYEVEVEKSDAVLTSVTPVAAAPAPSAVETAAKTAPAAPAQSGGVDGTKVVSPMAGTILEIKVQVGQNVKAGDALVVLEAMKMENDIVAPADGTVKEILAAKGANVDADDILVVI